MFPTKEKKVFVRFELNQLGPDKSQRLPVAGLSKGYRFRHTIKYCFKIAFSNLSKKSAGEKWSERGREVFKATLPWPEMRL